VAKGQRKIYGTADNGEEKEYSVQRGVHVNVQEGERLKAGEPLMDGPLNPHDIRQTTKAASNRCLCLVCALCAYPGHHSMAAESKRLLRNRLIDPSWRNTGVWVVAAPRLCIRARLWSGRKCSRS
jgi:hypothetical protein